MANPKILLVDDVELFLEMQKDVFRRDSFTLLTARGGWEALEVMGRERPDLVFMDFFMPNGRGDEACAKAKADLLLRNIPIVIVTNSKKPEDLSTCRKTGCDEILFKPIDRERFLATAYRFLHISKTNSDRVQLRLPVRFGKEAAVLTDSWSFDLSLEGVFVETADFLPLGSELYVEITLPTPQITLTGQARVARANLSGGDSQGRYPRGMGLQFLDLGRAHRDVLNGFLCRMRTEMPSPQGKVAGQLVH